MCHSDLVREYLSGPALVRDAVAGMTAEELRARPVAGRWSTLEVVCHLADAEALYADRIKRVIAENEPSLLRADPGAWASELAYQGRNLEDELRLIELIRRQTAHILHALSPKQFQRRGFHSADGPLTLETLLRRATDHMPHHVRFIHAKRVALRGGCPCECLPCRGKFRPLTDCDASEIGALLTRVGQGHFICPSCRVHFHGWCGSAGSHAPPGRYSAVCPKCSTRFDQELPFRIRPYGGGSR
jgi:hypothetical protein